MSSSYLKNLNKKQSKVRSKSEIIAEHVDHVQSELTEILSDESLSDFEKRMKIKSALFYWLGIVYDDSNLNAQELSREMSDMKKTTERLKLSNDALKNKLKNHIIQEMEEV